MPLDSTTRPDTTPRESLQAAVAWLGDVAQITGEDLGPNTTNPAGLKHQHWRGAIRGEYSAAMRQWWFFCPVWHTGQAVKAFVLAAKALDEPSLLDSARLGAEFIGKNRIDDPADEDQGLILAYEDQPDVVNTSAILECCDGLFHLADATGEKHYETWALEAVDWTCRKTYRWGEGLFRDRYAPDARELRPWEPWEGQYFQGGHRGRPLNDDGILLKAYQRTGREEYKTAFLEIAGTLLRDEEPAGNWLRYRPCTYSLGLIHPRHAYWWGTPMLDAYRETNDEKYLHCARRAADWYVHALRHDGGLFRGTYADFTTDSFGHCTSGAACAAILFGRLVREFDQPQYREPHDRVLAFCRSVQLMRAEDPNLRGAILEKVLPPDGTDRSPYYLRDLGTIFYVQAAAAAMIHPFEAPPA